VSLVDALPAEMSLVWRSAGSVATAADGTISWDLGTVPPGGSAQILIGARLDDAVPPGTAMTNTAVVSTVTPDLDQDDNQVQVPLGPPRAICVPWVGDDPHRVWDGLATTLKGTAVGYALTHYEWDPGDGSPPITGQIDDPYVIEASHTYHGPVGTVYSATLTVWGALGWSDSDTYAVQIYAPIHGVRKDVAIDEGLWYLHKSADRYRERGLPFARWEWGGNPVAVNASVVQAFQVHGHRPGGDPLEDPYVEDVHAGWNAIFDASVLDLMTVQPAGDPDGDGDGVGIGMYEDYNHSIYESGLALMALATTGTPDRVASTGPVGYVRGAAYSDIAQDMVDWFAWGQNDADEEDEWARGGWRYQPNSGDSDNSNTQFPVLGLAAAEDNWGIAVPGWVRDELRDYWLARTQNPNGAFGYMGPWGMLNVGKTGAGIMDLIWAGVPVDDPRVSSAAQYIEIHWSDPVDEHNSGGNVGDLYAMYAVKKGSQLAGILNYGPHFWDYAYTAYLVDVQGPDGRFDEDSTLGVWFGDWQPVSTAWALLILSPGLYEALPVAIISSNQYGMVEPLWLEGQVQFDGTASYHTDPDRELVEYAWSFGDGGTAAATLTPFHLYGDDGLYVVTLVVTDDVGQSDTDTLLLTVDNVPPTVSAIAAPLAPVRVETPIHTSATFTDPGVLDTHTALWDWGDGRTSDGIVDEENGSGSVTASHTYTTPGVYTVRLIVTDDDGGSGESVFKYVVVYDPDGGFVTGGGWIDSPEGAYVPDPSLVGKANFGFVSKYKKGAKVPTGQTEFQFHVADLNFHSSSYEWLVIARARAQYKGVGTINGQGNYGFMLTAVDASLTKSTDVDLFRIKIWDRDTGDLVIYDNQMGHDDDADPATEIAGGNITIHKK
jgi:PKD repeat protein